MLILRRITAGIVLGAALGLAAIAPCGAMAADGPTPYSLDNQLDLNRASLEQIEALPISPELARAIHDYRSYRSYFSDLFQLLEVGGVTPAILKELRPLVFITPPFQILSEEMDESQQREEGRYYLVQRLLSEEGASEGRVDEYVDQLRDPLDVNQLGFFDLISYQNVSPVDAVAVLKEKEQTGKIENQRQLRSASGISYWGYRNLRDFVRYDNPDSRREIHGDYQVRLYNTPYLLDDADNLTSGIVNGGVTNFDTNTYAGRLNLDSANPYLTNKLRLRWGTRLKAAILTHRNLGESEWDATRKFSLSADNFNPVDTPLGVFRLHHAVGGNFRVAFGQGLIMDSSDFFMPRTTGYGYGVRSVGLRSDISRSDEYTLRGGAVEATLGNVRGTVFYSQDDKDAILNPDGSFNRYFAMVPRIDNDLMAEIRADVEAGVLGGGDPNAFLPMRDVMDERVAGANFKYEFVPGTYVGLTGVEMRYHNNVFDGDLADRWNPNPGTLVVDEGRLEDRDAELYQDYNSMDLGNYRRIWGAEAQTVYRNVSVAGEYGKLETSDADGAIGRIFDRGPEAKVAHAYIQYENFNFLALYRDYDIGYDNPYNRAFAEDGRYEQTLLDGNPFRLKNPFWAQLAMGNPQPKSEQGWYFSTRYQFTRNFTLSGLEFDTWKRKADGADLKRLTVRAEYRPIFPVRFRIRHRISSRHDDRPQDVRRFNSWDSRIQMRVNLSRYSQMEFLYSTSNVAFSARGRLNGPASGGDTQADSTASRGIPAKALQAKFTHNFNDYLSLTFSTEIYDGFLYNFEDNEFVVVDGNGYRNWFMLRSRLSESLSWRLKWTTDHQLARTYVDVRNFGNLVNPTPDATNAREDRTSYRFQLDYSF